MNPDQYLAQIADLCQQFLAAGGDPAQVVQAIQPVLDGSGGQGGEQPPGGPPPDGIPDADAMGAVPDLSGMMPSAPPSSNGGGHPFADASAMAIEDIKKRQKSKA